MLTMDKAILDNKVLYNDKLLCQHVVEWIYILLL